jgi:hypothetical protein
LIEILKGIKKEKDYSIIIDGETLKIILKGPGFDKSTNKKIIEEGEKLKIIFLRLCMLCKTVICCRV